MNKNTRR